MAKVGHRLRTRVAQCAESRPEHRIVADRVDQRGRLVLPGRNGLAVLVVCQRVNEHRREGARSDVGRELLLLRQRPDQGMPVQPSGVVLPDQGLNPLLEGLRPPPQVPKGSRQPPQPCKAEFPSCKVEFTCLAQRAHGRSAKGGRTRRPTPACTTHPQPPQPLVPPNKRQRRRPLVVRRQQIRTKLQQQWHHLRVRPRGQVKRSRTGPRPRADSLRLRRPGPG